MPNELDPGIAEQLVSSTISSLNPPRGNKVVCTKRALRSALLAAVQEAHSIGFLAGQKKQHEQLVHPGSPARPAWMDIRLDDPAELDRHRIRIRPVVRESLLAAGYRLLGDLRWVQGRRVRGLHYIGIKTERALRAIVRRFEEAEPSLEDDVQH
jgi:hypothetical protein